MSMAFSTPDSKPTHLHPRSEKDSSSLPTVAKRACFEEAAQQLEDKSGESRSEGFTPEKNDGEEGGREEEKAGEEEEEVGDSEGAGEEDAEQGNDDDQLIEQDMDDQQDQGPICSYYAELNSKAEDRFATIQGLLQKVRLDQWCALLMMKSLAFERGRHNRPRFVQLAQDKDGLASKLQESLCQDIQSGQERSSALEVRRQHNINRFVLE